MTALFLLPTEIELVITIAILIGLLAIMFLSESPR